MAACRARRHSSAAHPDFPLRGFVRCESCGRGLTGSWSKGRSGYYAYYHCRARCRAVNVSKAKLEGLFVRRTRTAAANAWLHAAGQGIRAAVWKARKAAVREELATAERSGEGDPGEAGPSGRGVPLRAVDRHRRPTTATRQTARGAHARPDRPSRRGQLDELDVEGILAFAERVLPRAADLWVQASLEQRQRLQQLFFPEGIAFDGNGFVGTGVTAPAFSYLRPIEDRK